MYTATNDVKTHKFETNQVDEKGKKKWMKVTVRKMLLHNPTSIFEPKDYRITVVKRKTGLSFAISGLFPPTLRKWAKNELILDARLIPQPEWRKAEKSKTEEQLLQWLKSRIINPADAVNHLLNDEPEETEMPEAA